MLHERKARTSNKSCKDTYLDQGHAKTKNAMNDTLDMTFKILLDLHQSTYETMGADEKLQNGVIPGVVGVRVVSGVSETFAVTFLEVDLKLIVS